MYRFAVADYAKGVGKNFYEEVARILRKMKKIQGGEQVVTDLIKLFLEKYKSRRLMREILTKIK